MTVRRVARTLIGILCVLLLIWCASLIKCEILTKNHYDAFVNTWKDNPMLSEIEYFKVLKCNRGIAQVYYVERDMLCGHVLTFENVGDTWIETGWNTIWSGKGGSASGVVYPYIWHFVYGGL